MKDLYIAQHINTNIFIDRYLTDRQILKYVAMLVVFVWLNV